MIVTVFFMDGIYIIVMCGGRGTRFSNDVPEQYGSKSLIPMMDRAVVDYVFQVLAAASADLGQIFLCIEREELRSRIEEKMGLRGLRHASIFICQDNGPLYPIYELRERFTSSKVLALFGHQIVTPRFVREMATSDAPGAVVSLYKTSSENFPKITSVDHEHGCRYWIRGDASSKLKADEYYGDVPYLFPRAFIDGLKDERIRYFDAIKRWFDTGGEMHGQIADFPPEFHYSYELAAMASIARGISKEGGSRC